jgi:hypothetical protein
MTETEAEAGGEGAGLWCVVGNIVGEHPYGPGGEDVRSGLKKLRPNSKVYVIGGYGGMGWERITVVGRLRYNNKYIVIDIASKYLRNHRVKLIYSPTVIRAVERESNRGGAASEDREKVESFLDTIVSYAGQFRVRMRGGPFAGDRQTFEVGAHVPEVLELADAEGRPAAYRLKQVHHRDGTIRNQWYEYESPVMH